MTEKGFFFMAYVKDELETFMPAARVTVEPYQQIGVMIEVKWRLGGGIVDTTRIVSLNEILYGTDVAKHTIETIKQKIAEAEAEHAGL